VNLDIILMRVSRVECYRDIVMQKKKRFADITANWEMLYFQLYSIYIRFPWIDMLASSKACHFVS